MPLPVLVMLPGSLCDARVFAAQRRQLRGVCRVWPVDYRLLDRREDWLDGLLRSLPDRFSLAGFSLGGLWALEILRRVPQRVERVALIASNAQPASAVARQRSRKLWRLWRHRGAGVVADGLKPGYFHHPADRRRHAATVRSMALATPSSAAAAEFRWAAHRPDSHRVLAGFAGPVLIVSGHKDRLCPPDWQRAMVDAQPSAQWLSLPRVGHFVPLEAPAALGGALRHWMGRAASP